MVFLFTSLLFAALLASTALGWSVRTRLHERHLLPNSVESIRLLMGMLLTISALVLGLLTSNAKQRFDTLDADLGVFAAGLIELDHRLVLYGPDAQPTRALLRRYTAAAIADSWPREPLPPGEYPRFAHTTSHTGIEGQALGGMLSDVDLAIERLAPADAFHVLVAERLRDRAANVIQQRWRLIFSTAPPASWPILMVLDAWLVIIFAIFGLTAPRTRVIAAIVVMAALSVASSVFLIVDYADASTGLLHLSSAPMRAALAHMDLPR